LGQSPPRWRLALVLLLVLTALMLVPVV